MGYDGLAPAGLRVRIATGMQDRSLRCLIFRTTGTAVDPEAGGSPTSGRTIKAFLAINFFFVFAEELARIAAPMLRSFSLHSIPAPPGLVRLFRRVSLSNTQVTAVYSATWPGGFASSVQDFHKGVSGLLPKLHSLVMGPGMGREQRLQVALTEVLRSAIGRDLPLVLDADALVLVACDGHVRLTHEDLQGRSVSELDSLLRCYRRLVLTPNAYEFKLLDQRIKSSGAAVAAEPGPEGANGELAVEHAAKSLGGVTIVRKGKVDVISDGLRTVSCGVPGGLKRCGGIGDVLSGAMGTFMAWVSIQGFVEPEVGSEACTPALMHIGTFQATRDSN